MSSTTRNYWDAHRPGRKCVYPRSLGLVQTKNGIWLRALDLVPNSGQKAAAKRFRPVAKAPREHVRS